MAFFAPIAYQAQLKGKKPSYYFKQGTHLLIDALKKELLKKGVKISTKICVTQFKNGMLHTQQGQKYKADRYLFASTVHPQLYQQLLGSKISCDYTEYFTVVMQLKKPIDVGKRAWGALFFGSDENRPYQIMSLVNLHHPFHCPHPAQVMVNLVVRNRESKPLTHDELKKILESDSALSHPKKIELKKWTMCSTGKK